jgi:phage baseplate assembly protein W
MAAARHLDVAFHLAGSGRVATTGDDDHVRDMIFSVLFTDPGERVNRPEFGCGLKAMVFAPGGRAAAATTQLLVKGALQRALEAEIAVDDVDVRAVESELIVTVAYRRRTDGRRRVGEFRSPA